MKIGKKLIISFLAVALLVGIMGYTALTISKNILTETIGTESMFLAEEILDGINREIGHRVELIEIFSKYGEFTNTAIESNKEFKNLTNITEFIIEMDKEWRSIPLAETNPFIDKLLNKNLSIRMNNLLNAFAQKYGYFVYGEMFITNKYGGIAALSGKTFDYKQDDEEWWQKSKEEGSYIGIIEYDRSAGIQSKDIVFRMEDKSGNFIGVIKGVLNVEEIIIKVKRLRLKEGHKFAKYSLLNKNCESIYSSGYAKSVSEVCKKNILPNVDKEKEYFITKTDQKERLISYSIKKGYDNNVKWILILEHNKEDILTPVTILKRFIIIFSLLLTITAVVFGSLISYSISKPIMNLRNKAKAIGEGNLDIKIETESKDEVGELASSLTGMKNDLKRSRKNLENSNINLKRKVIEKTKELQKRIEELERIHKLTVGRELEMIKLKKKIKEMENKESLKKNRKK